MLLVNNNIVFTDDSFVYLDTDDDSIVDYCSNPSDAWPIMAENGIATIPTGRLTVWCAIHNPQIDRNNQIHANILEYGKNPLRAAMICFLKMKDVEK